jgi:hypothetical protein
VQLSLQGRLLDSQASGRRFRVGLEQKLTGAFRAEGAQSSFFAVTVTPAELSNKELYSNGVHQALIRVLPLPLSPPLPPPSPFLSLCLPSWDHSEGA